MRETTAELCDLRLGGDESAFGVSTSTWHLGSALLIEGRSTPLHYDRTRAHVAASGLDHYQVQCYLRGGQSTEGGGRDYVLAPGDIGICDMARANRTIVDGTGPRQSAHFLTLFVPRALLAPLLRHPTGRMARSSAGRRRSGGCLLARCWRSAAKRRDWPRASASRPSRP
jgi:hypothetical protein